MTKSGKRFLATCAATLVAMGLSTATATATPVATQGLLDSCAAVRAVVPVAPDGNYVLSTDRYLVGVYCHDMAGNPREYLNLSFTGPSLNYSQYTAGGASPGTNVRTAFTKLRVDPKTLTVDINDTTFATSSGTLTHGGDRVTSVAYAVAMACNGSAGVGQANLDLRGTAFTVASTFAPGGFTPFGTATPSSDGQVVALTGGGYCGWNAPSAGVYNPYNPQGPKFILGLSCAKDGLFRPQICLDLR
ncbi:GON domain-containing protein [Actinokineospora diospyrosa]|uniref:GON domain-containing protein n=1 Tax=Actinokineospora diospyrosa TaxID=103728 RepID=A0ABT1IBC7_9PSEU|nr:GON domain-containing protein [Actinokineospora diospyrosa]MCP2269927.1 GON domain-containing protein [Actinokineospora diospyrosa]